MYSLLSENFYILSFSGNINKYELKIARIAKIWAIKYKSPVLITIIRRQIIILPKFEVINKNPTPIILNILQYISFIIIFNIDSITIFNRDKIKSNEPELIRL